MLYADMSGPYAVVFLFIHRNKNRPTKIDSFFKAGGNKANVTPAIDKSIDNTISVYGE